MYQPPKHNCGLVCFKGCTALHHLNLDKSECSPAYPNRSLPDCCFLEVGIVALFLPPDFNRIGSAACVSCQQLQTVDLSQTCVIEILAQPLHTAHSCSNSAFSEIYESLSKKPFSSVPRCKKSASHHLCFILRGVLLQVARSFEQFLKREKQNMARYICPAPMHNKCEQLDKPKWLRFLPPNAKDQWREDFQEAIP